MPITHSLTDKENKKFRRTLLQYLLVILAVISLPFLFKDKGSNITNVKGIKDVKYICLTGEIQPAYIGILNTYANNNGYQIDNGSNADCYITIARNIKDINNYTRLTNKIYMVVGRFDNLTSDISTTQLKEALITQKYKGNNIIWDTETDDFLKSSFETIGVGQKVYTQEEVTSSLSRSPNILTIIPFEKLTNKHKVLSIDGLNPLEKDFSSLRYPLADKYWISGPKDVRDSISKLLYTTVPETNYESKKLTTLVLTGSSAFGSGIQQKLINQRGLSFISQSLRNIIETADIAQINNEASLSQPCVQSETSSKYCTTQENLKLLKSLGFDIVGVNGNHIMDISYSSYIDTLNWYKANGLEYYAGGLNSSDACTPRIVTANGLKFAFIGFNFLYPFSYYATKTTAGSANVDLNIMKETISKARKTSNIVIMDMGWGYEYQSNLLNYQTEFAQKALDYGADIVIGTNSRVFQKTKIGDDKSIFYGLGAFLPQTYKSSLSAIYRLTFYNGKPVNTTVFPITLTGNTVELASGSQSDTILKALYKQLEIK
ncbi:MAG: hypothetical protein UT34_C0001G0188 [candidate division WS6 bacterium GW2011_GWF2_39_15]|uniref:Capsule synthesis protein CapA domain-containing protein n=1 Tax=candidate division WS6 bacterium GW2011_GWF2_39_15 TaxID=1619100 RepID=A0A0G0MSN0_9BACT|nr:MAG: hypothetical protein UT34_C0001G0188 [candidate division WS6 bacterium GW2011_GWF2_39_15]